METTYREWEKRRQEREAGRRSAPRRRRGAAKAALGPREKRRLLQLAVCVLLFAVVFLGKGVFPDKMAAARERMLEVLQSDTDFKAAFLSLGKSISEGEPVLETLGELWIDVFGGGETVTVSGALSLSRAPTFQAQSAFLSGYPRRAASAAHWLGGFQVCPPVPVPQEPAAQPEPQPEPTPEPTPEPPPPVEHVAYDGPALPDNATMDKYNLGVLGVAGTVTPALGWVSSGFGWREHPVDGAEKFHNGVDLAVNDGTDVLAFADGTVDYIGESPVYGQYLQLRHAGGLTTFYAHCSTLLVQQGQSVTAGQRVAQSGETGNVTGPHLHFEIKLDGVLLNPLYYIETS